MSSQIAATLACRAESTRLYGKPLQPVGDCKILTRLINQIDRIDSVDKIVLAIADTPSQTSFIDFAERHGLEYVVGSETDVLLRLIKAAKAVNADTVLRTTTENPFKYWENVDDLIKKHRTTGADITVTKQLPLGAGTQIIETKALEESHEKGTDKHRSELCTLYIKENASSFNIQTIDPPDKLKRPDIRVTVDNPCDLIFVRAIYDELSNRINTIQIDDIVELVERKPEILKINDHKPDGTSDEVRDVSLAYE